MASIFEKETGQDIDDYGQKYLFAPLGIRHEWKRTYLGVVDTEGGLYLNGSDLAKIGYLYLHHGMWDGRRIISSEWVKASVTPQLQTDEPQFKYGFKWWLSKLPDSAENVRLGRGFGGQNLQAFPKGRSDCDLYGLGHSLFLDFPIDQVFLEAAGRNFETAGSMSLGTGEGTFLEYPLKPVQLDSGRDRRLGVQFWSSSGISALYRIMPEKSASPPKTR